MGKQNCYEHSVRVPLIFAGPGVPEGRRSQAFAYLFDIFPTVCELTNTALPASVEGESLVAAMRDATATVRDTLYFAYVSSQRAVKNRTHKLIEYAARDSARQTQLFDLENDPWEMENLAGKPGVAHLVEELRGEMFHYREHWESGHTERSARFWERYA